MTEMVRASTSAGGEGFNVMVFAMCFLLVVAIVATVMLLTWDKMDPGVAGIDDPLG